MQDNASSDNESQDLDVGPGIGAKKTKLNNGSPRSTFTDIFEDYDSDDYDNKVSGDTSKNTYNDVPGPSTSGEPPDDVVIATPSTSAVHADILKMKNETLTRNYGKRNGPYRITSNLSSVEASVHQSTDFIPSTSRQDNSSSSYSNTEIEIDDIQTEVEVGESTPEDEVEAEPYVDVEDSISEEAPEYEPEPELPEGVEIEEMPGVLLKKRPNHNYFILKEVLNRELGLSFPRSKATIDNRTFAQRFCSSLHSVLRMTKLYNLPKHNASVNSIHFHPEGQLLVSGSDDAEVILWDWARKIPLHIIETGHKSSIFQSKFLYLNSGNQLDIVTCGKDGQVRLCQCGSAGGTWVQRRLAGHGKAVNKLYLSPEEPHSVLSAGEDGLVLQCDLRSDTVNKLIQVKERNVAIALYSLDGHPLEPRELAIAGRDKFIRLYDRRKLDKHFALYCPTVFTEEITIDRRTMRLSTMHLTCALYNHNGTELLGSYNDDDIYLFNIKTDSYTKGISSKNKKGYIGRYTGHRNSATLKGVTFYGHNSEYIISGSDCGYMYIWDKHTESIVQWLQGEVNGMVNSVETHPRLPILASGGLDNDVKLWAPHSLEDPTYEGLSDAVRNNSFAQWQAPLFNEFLSTGYRSWRGENRLVVDYENLPYYGQVELEANICTTF